MQMLDPSNEPNRPHISSVNHQFQRARHKNQTVAPFLFGAARPILISIFCPPRVSCVPSGVPLCASAPPVRGYLRIGAGTRKCFLQKSSIFFRKAKIPTKYRVNGKKRTKSGGFGAIFLSCPTGNLHLPRLYPQANADSVDMLGNIFKDSAGRET